MFQLYHVYENKTKLITAFILPQLLNPTEFFADIVIEHE